MIRAAVFFLLIVLTWYLAGMYRYPVLLILCGIEMLILIGAVPLSHSFRRRLQICFPAKRKVAVMGEETACPVKGTYSGFLSVIRFSLTMQLSYTNGEKHRVQKLWGSCERGSHEMLFPISPLYCGILEIRLKQLQTFDYFSVFSAKKEVSDKMRITVFPKPQSLNLRLSSTEQKNVPLTEEYPFRPIGDGRHEIRQIREYRAGDPIRHIHWNLSARMDSLWLKEFERETESAVHITLDLCGTENGQAQCSAFYTLVYAFVTGLQKYIATVWIQWFDEQKKMWQKAAAANEDQCRNAIALLYLAKCTRKLGKESTGARPIPEKEDFRLNLDLELFSGNRQVHRFSLQTLEQEIREYIFDL